LGVPVKGAGLVDGIEVFPKHDELDPGSFGNAIRGPLGIHRGASRRFWFYGADYTLAAQMEYLKRLRKVKDEEMRQFVAGKELPPGVARRQQEAAPAVPYERRSRRPEFRILDHVGKVRRAGRNYVARCPSCAASGGDQAGDNLAIFVANPRYYQCWAGCTKEMIRAALGHPIPLRQPGVGKRGKERHAR